MNLFRLRNFFWNGGLGNLAAYAEVDKGSQNSHSLVRGAASGCVKAHLTGSATSPLIFPTEMPVQSSP